ncbi:MAG: radical SAM protein [Elusimicrobia bacterium]|nr:radical SAM protein [Elusimicrobiota bacterium]
MKVYLIKPLQSNFAVASPFSTITTEAGIYPPLGLLQLATGEKIRGCHAVSVIDMVAEGLSLAALQSILERERPAVAGVTLHTDNLGDGCQVIALIKSVSPDIAVLAGGPHVAMYPKETMGISGVDYAVCGEADGVLGEMLDRLAAGKPLEDIPGVVTRANLHLPIVKLEIEDLDGLAIPDYSLLPYKKYSSILTRNNPIAIIMASRGCPFKCAYCPAGGTKLRRRSPKLVADEVEKCLSLGIKDILFFDEIFALDHARVKELCALFVDRGLKFRWNIRTRVGDITPEIVSVLKNAGCNLIQFGIESGTQRIQKLMNKNLDLDDVYKRIQWVRQAGILTYGNFMLGSPTETDEEINATVSFAIRLKLDFAVFGITVLLPKTEYYSRALRENKIPRDFWGDYIANPLVQIPNAYWPDFDKKYLEKKCKEAFSRFYLRPWYVFNYMTRIARMSNIAAHIKPAMNVFKNFFSDGAITK